MKLIKVVIIFVAIIMLCSVYATSDINKKSVNPTMPGYDIIDLGTWGDPPYEQSDGHDVNEHDVVIGTGIVRYNNYSWVVKVFRWENFSAQEMPSGGSASPKEINNIGSILGNSYLEAYLWKDMELTVLDSLQGYEKVDAFGINDDDIISGALSLDWYSTNMTAALWKDLKPFLLPKPDYCDETAAYDINNEGIAVGTCIQFKGRWEYQMPLLWQNNDVINLFEILPESKYLKYPSHAMAINNNDQVLIRTTVDVNGEPYKHSLIWNDRHITDITHNLEHDYYSYDMNDAGEVVGFYYDSNYNEKAFLWSEGVMYDLNDFVSSLEWKLEYAKGINNQGHIVGKGRKLVDGQFQTRGYLLIPR